MWTHVFLYDKPLISNNLIKAWRKAWFCSVLLLFISCTVSATELKAFRLVESTPLLCLEDELTPITFSGYRFLRPVFNRLHKVSVFSSLCSSKLKTDSALIKTFFTGKSFLSILVIILFFYYYHLAGEEGDKSASNLAEVFNL